MVANACGLAVEKGVLWAGAAMVTPVNRRDRVFGAPRIDLSTQS
jgi:hypothetical protein